MTDNASSNKNEDEIKYLSKINNNDWHGFIYMKMKVNTSSKLIMIVDNASSNKNEDNYN